MRWKLAVGVFVAVDIVAGLGVAWWQWNHPPVVRDASDVALEELARPDDAAFGAGLDAAAQGVVSPADFARVVLARELSPGQADRLVAALGAREVLFEAILRTRMKEATLPAWFVQRVLPRVALHEESTAAALGPFAGSTDPATRAAVRTLVASKPAIEQVVLDTLATRIGGFEVPEAQSVAAFQAYMDMAAAPRARAKASDALRGSKGALAVAVRAWLETHAKAPAAEPGADEAWVMLLDQDRSVRRIARLALERNPRTAEAAKVVDAFLHGKSAAAAQALERLAGIELKRFRDAAPAPLRAAILRQLWDAAVGVNGDCAAGGPARAAIAAFGGLAPLTGAWIGARFLLKGCGISREVFAFTRTWTAKQADRDAVTRGLIVATIGRGTPDAVAAALDELAAPGTAAALKPVSGAVVAALLERILRETAEPASAGLAGRVAERLGAADLLDRRPFDAFLARKVGGAELFVELLDDKGLGAAARDALERVPGANAARRKMLAERLAAPEANVRLAALGDDCVRGLPCEDHGPVRSASKDADPTVRVRAAVLLARAPCADPQPLLATLSDASDDARLEALRAAADEVQLPVDRLMSALALLEKDRAAAVAAAASQLRRAGGVMHPPERLDLDGR